MAEVRSLDRGFSLSDVLSETPEKPVESESEAVGSEAQVGVEPEPRAIKPASEVHDSLMLEDIEEGELDYEDGDVLDEGEELPDLPEYDPSVHNNQVKAEVESGSEEGEIISDGENDDREEGEIKDDDDTGQVFICVDPVEDKWKKVSRSEQKQFKDLEDGQIDDKPEDGQINGSMGAKPGACCRM